MNLRQLMERGDRPFTPQPQVGRYFPAQSAEEARRRLGRTVERGDGPGVVIGAAGSGKSLLLQVLAAQYRERFDVVLLACAQLCTRRALLQAIHFELGLDYRRRDEGQLRLRLLDQLLASDATEGLLLLVDEAQTLAPHLLEELRLLTNLARRGLPRVRLVLAGLPTLEEKLTSPELEAFSQRIAARCYLAPFSRDETSRFVGAQLAASSADPQLFTAAAIEAVFNATDGVPRLVNQLCDRALLLAADRQLAHVDPAAVQAAWADLQQLPTPWEAAPESSTPVAAEEAVIEFGALAAEPVPPPATASTPTIPLRPTPEPRPSSLSIDTGRLADRMAAMPLINAESGVDEPVEPTELDDAEENVTEPAADGGFRIADWRAGSSSTPIPSAENRPARTKPPSEIAPAVDPFADAFDEEEILLESFASLAGIIGPQTPRVENRRDAGFARMVREAFDASEFVVGEGPPQATRSPRPPIRLAVVDEPPVPPVPEVAVGEPEIAESILVIEDDAEAAAASRAPGVRREEYRQLFSRLRHGA